MRRGQRIRIRRRHVLAMPLVGWASQFARALGVSPEMVSRWIRDEGCPAREVGKSMRYRNVGRGGHWQIRRKDFVDWLVQTGRYKRGRGYDE
jgi:hypothetical protein